MPTNAQRLAIALETLDSIALLSAAEQEEGTLAHRMQGIRVLVKVAKLSMNGFGTVTVYKEEDRG